MAVAAIDALNYVDLLLLIAVGLFAWLHSGRGVFVVGVELLLLVVNFALAFRFYHEAGELIVAPFGGSRAVGNALGFLAVLLVGQLVLGAIEQQVLRRLPRDWHGAVWSRLLALVPATMHGGLLATAVLLVLVVLPIHPGLRDDISSSAAGGRLVQEGVALERALAGVFGGALQETLTFLTVRPEGDERVTLRATPSRTEIAPAAEFELLRMVNAERRRHGVGELVMDEAMVEVARRHSEDMWERAYFGHVNPDGATPFDRLRDGGVDYAVAGENLALAPTLEQAHRGLMDSPGHRRNILDDRFRRAGFGIIDGGPHGLMVTQTFAD